jgi:hypothetical protein
MIPDYQTIPDGLEPCIFRHRAKIQAGLIPQMGKEIFLLDLPFTPLYKKWHSYNGILKP